MRCDFALIDVQKSDVPPIATPSSGINYSTSFWAALEECMLKYALKLRTVTTAIVKSQHPSTLTFVRLTHTLQLTQSDSPSSTRRLTPAATSHIAHMAAATKREISSRSSSPSSSIASTSSSPPPLKNSSPARKKAKADLSDSLAPGKVSRLSKEHPVWPAPAATIEKATEFIKRAARSEETILLVPDKDADGLSAGLIVKRTLIHLGASPEDILEHHIPAGKNPASQTEREKYEAYGAKWIIVLDQGSPTGPPLVKGAEKGWQSDEEGAVRTMVLDHHHVVDLDKEGPEGSLLLNACKHEPVSTSALLAWVVCRPMWGEDASPIDYLAIIGTCGDLSINVKWDEPWPDFASEVKRLGKQKIGLAVSMINAREYFTFCLENLVLMKPL